MSVSIRDVKGLTKKDHETINRLGVKINSVPKPRILSTIRRDFNGMAKQLGIKSKKKKA
jgi:hypothetical protein